MYLPFKFVTMEEDGIGNLQIWLGENIPKPTNEEKIAYIQTSQDKSNIYANCFGFEDENIEELAKGYTVVAQLHIDYIADIFS